MPLFGKFSAKKVPARKSSMIDNNRDIEDYNFLEDDNVVRLCLGDNELVFEDGQWTSDGSDGFKSKANQKLRKQAQTLKEENNLLQLKFEVLLDMVSEKTVEGLQQQQQVEKYKRK